MSREIVDALRKAVNGEEIPQTIVGKVKFVDLLTATCVVEPLNGDADINEVRFMADPSGKTKYVPKVGSIVVCQLFSNTAGALICYSDLDEINLMGSNFGGMVKIQILLQKLNNLEALINQLIVNFNTHTHIDTVTSAPISPPTVPFTQTLVPTQLVELENTLVKHGN